MDSYLKSLFKICSLVLLVFILGCKEKDNALDGSDSDKMKNKWQEYFQSDQYKAELEKQKKKMTDEYAVVESAAWFGTTGLDEDTERHVSKYLRLELGESVFDKDSLKASDLVYIGVFPTTAGRIHFWRIPWKDKEEVYAYVEEDSQGNITTGWGDQKPPSDINPHK